MPLLVSDDPEDFKQERKSPELKKEFNPRRPTTAKQGVVPIPSTLKENLTLNNEHSRDRNAEELARRRELILQSEIPKSYAGLSQKESESEQASPHTLTQNNSELNELQPY